MHKMVRKRLQKKMLKSGDLALPAVRSIANSVSLTVTRATSSWTTRAFSAEIRAHRLREVGVKILCQQAGLGANILGI
jgi:hypothetical protein